MSRHTYTQDQMQCLVKLALKLLTEAQGCADAKRWRAAIVLMASSIEAAILATAFLLEPDLRKRGLWPRENQRLITKRELGWLLNLASEAGWLPRQQKNTENIFELLEGDVGDAVDFVSRLRNAALHPGNFVESEANLGADFDDPALMKRPTN